MLEDDLAYFVAVAGAGSMARAAERLGVTQPALSKAIQRLERRVGVPLLVRGAQGAEPTEAGRAFLARSRALTQDLDDAMQEARDLGNGSAGILRIGSTPAGADFALDTLLPRLIEERPVARISFTSGFSDALLAAVARREIELALLPMPYLPGAVPASGHHGSMPELTPGLACRHLIDDSYRLVVNREHRLASQASVTMADLDGCTWASSTPHEFARKQMERVFALHGMALPRVVVESNNMAALLMAVSRLPLASLVNPHSVSPASLPANVVMLPIDSEHIRCPIGLVWRQGYLSSLALRARELLETAALSFQT
jgi:DNA-binding transcriptional LysR family regulator